MSHDAPDLPHHIDTLEQLEALQDQVLIDLQRLDQQLTRVLKEATRLMKTGAARAEPKGDQRAA